MVSNLQSQLESDLKQAQLDHDAVKVSTLRLLLSEVRNTQIAKGEELFDAEIISVVQKEVKKRKEAASGFRQGGREEDAVKEEEEAKILKFYLPEQLSDEELTKLVEDAINSTGAKSLSDMGRIIGVVMGKVAGKAEGARVSAIVKEKLSVVSH